MSFCAFLPCPPHLFEEHDQGNARRPYPIQAIDLPLLAFPPNLPQSDDGSNIILRENDIHPLLNDVKYSLLLICQC